MAINIFQGTTTSNWGSTSSWSLGRIPTATDNDVAYFGPTSPTCSVNITATCSSFDCSTYLRQIQLNNNLNIFGTYSAFGTNSTIRFSNTFGNNGGGIFFSGTQSITTNGYVFKQEVGGVDGGVGFGYSNRSYTITLLDQFEATNINFNRTSGTPNITVNGATLSAITTFSGGQNINIINNSNIQLRGTSSTSTTTLTLNSFSPISGSVFINTPGSAIISFGSFIPNNNTLKWLSGSVSIGNIVMYTGTGSAQFTYDIPPIHRISSLVFNTRSGLSTSSVTFSSIRDIDVTSIIMSGGSGGTSKVINLTSGFTCSSFLSNNANANETLEINLATSSTYTINDSFTVNSVSNLTRTTIKSLVRNQRTNVYVHPNATQSVFNTYFNDINATGASIMDFLSVATISSVNNNINVVDLKPILLQNTLIQVN